MKVAFCWKHPALPFENTELLHRVMNNNEKKKSTLFIIFFLRNSDEGLK